ncbi:hypothetical protein PHMEG_00035432 [Phytophthora megakarya]|uniref:Uncharacterized protein n=1 Tax=Phytophthora megakarya TaxID=4795 RepID=A0A225UP71_9STRA|nr:hypothetical protein PHMEG_00035432 [Phytophthora megakarya]
MVCPPAAQNARHRPVFTRRVRDVGEGFVDLRHIPRPTVKTPLCGKAVISVRVLGPSALKGMPGNLLEQPIHCFDELRHQSRQLVKQLWVRCLLHRQRHRHREKGAGQEILLVRYEGEALLFCHFYPE